MGNIDHVTVSEHRCSVRTLFPEPGIPYTRSIQQVETEAMNKRTAAESVNYGIFPQRQRDRINYRVSLPASGLGMVDKAGMAERGVVRIVLSGSSPSEHETDTELEMKTRKSSNRSRRSNSENRYSVVYVLLLSRLVS